MKKGLRLCYYLYSFIYIVCQNRRPDEEGIKTLLEQVPTPWCGVRTVDLMKKGLRPVPFRVFVGFVVRTVDLMKKGLRPSFPDDNQFGKCVRTVDLMKKGLRRGHGFSFHWISCQNRRPDEEGIKTSLLLQTENNSTVRTVDLMKKGLRRSVPGWH